jgi:hypothetical protein
MKEQIANAVGELAAIPYFPADEYARRAIMRQIAKFVDRPDHLHWLVNAALNTMRHWDGMPPNVRRSPLQVIQTGPVRLLRNRGTKDGDNVFVQAPSYYRFRSPVWSFQGPREVR